MKNLFVLQLNKYQPSYLFWILGILLSLNFVSAVVSVYPNPGDLSPIAYLNKSDAFDVSVRSLKGAELTSFVYASTNYHTAVQRRPQDTVSFTSFVADEPVIVKIKCQSPVTSVIVRPTRLGIKPMVEGNTITLTMTEPKQISLEINDSKNPLLLFPEGPETLETSATYYYAPGTVTQIGTKKVLKDGESVYIAGGAVVEGTFMCNGGKNSFHGRGIFTSGYISWETWKADNSLCMFSYPSFKLAKESDFNGLVCLNSPGWYNRGQLLDSSVKNIKFLSWNGNSDGLHLGGNSIMEDCFFFNNDDCLIGNTGDNNIWRRCTLWLGPWGHPIISLLTERVSKNFLWEDIDVIGADGNGEMISLKNFKGKGVNGSVNDFVVRNIWIEGPRKGPLVKVDCETFGVKNFLLQNIKVESTVGKEGKLGLPSKGETGTVEFRNVTLNGKKMTSLEDFQITSSGDTSGIKISP